MAKTSLGTSIHGQDTQAIETLSNLAGIFSPENAADAQQRAAHAEYYRQHGEQAAAAKMHSLAQTKAINDQNAAYDVASLVQNGMTPLQAQMFVAARNHYSDATKGYNVARGGEMLASGQGDANTAAALTGLSPTINSAYTEKQRNDIIAQNSASKIAQLATQGQLHNQGLAQRGVVVPAGGMYIPGSSLNQPAPAVAPVSASANPSNLFDMSGQTQQLAPAGFMDSLGSTKATAPGIPAGAILNPKPAKADKGMSPSQVNAVDTRMRNGMTVLSDIVAGSGHGKDNPLNPGDANAIVTAATTKYPNLPAHQAIPQLIKDQNVQFNEKPSDWYNPVSWVGHNAIVPTAGGKPVQQGLSDIITGSQSAPAVNAPVSRIGMLDDSQRATAKQRIQANPALRTDFDTKFGAGASDELLAK
jgi:hypothetical protein